MRTESSLLAIGALLSSLAGASLAAPAPAPAAAPAPVISPAAADEGRLAGLFDPLLGEEMAKGHIPGAVVVVVSGDRVVFAKGYGYADLAAKRPVSPEDTVFRVASLAKPVAAVAALQQVERGRLDLAADVGRYLKDFKLRGDFPQPITLAHLLTHTAGFDELYLGTAARTEAEQLPLGRYLAERMPPRVLPPGQVISYSNHGMALAAHLVELASGMPYESYVQGSLFRPLGMAHSGYRLTAELKRGLALGYAGAAPRPVPYDYLNTAPVAGLLSTGGDMGRFLIAQLGRGRAGGTRVLGEAAADGLLTRKFSHHPDLPGRTYAYFEKVVRGQRVLGQEGDVRGFASGLYLLPERGLGLFVAGNAAVPELRDHAVEKLVEGLFPEPAAAKGAGAALARPTLDAGKVAGLYRFVRYPRGTIDKLAVMLGLAPQIRLTAEGAHGLAMDNGAEVVHLVEVAPGLLQNRDAIDLASGRGLAVLPDAQGGNRFVAFDEPAFERISALEAANFQLLATAAMLLVFLSACLVLPWRGRARRRRGVVAAAPFSGLALLACLLNLVFLVGLGVILGGTESYEFTYGAPLSIKLLLLIPPVTCLLALALPFLAVRAWRTGASRIGRLYDGVVVAACLLFIPFALYWNLLGAHF